MDHNVRLEVAHAVGELRRPLEVRAGGLDTLDLDAVRPYSPRTSKAPRK